MITGTFRERDVGNWFSYRGTTDPWAQQHGLEVEIDFPNTGEKRFAHVLKTVAYVAVDEDAEGKPVLQKWHIRNHNQQTQA